MPKVHVLLKKEEIDEDKINDQQIMVVFDVLLATTTIISALKNGANEVIPVMDHVEARKKAYEINEENCILAGEYGGLTLEGFLSPNPIALRSVVGNQTLILSTTNGTVAIKKSANAKQVLCASIINARAVSQKIKVDHEHDTIVIVCAGSGGQFNSEDFYGAGYLISLLLEDTDYELSDAAFAAYTFYEHLENQPLEVMKKSSVGKMLSRHHLDDVLEYVAQKSFYQLVPYLNSNRIVLDHSNEKI